MLIKKYQQDRLQQRALAERLRAYQAQADGFLMMQQGKTPLTPPLYYTALKQILPLAAIALTPFAMQAQACDPGSGADTIQDQDCGGNIATTVDVDGGADDLVFSYDSGAGLAVRAATSNGMTFARTESGVYRYLVGYADGGSINSASGFFGSLRSQPATSPCINNDQYGWLDYKAFGTGGWHGLTGQMLVMAFIKDDKLGFVEVTYDGTQTLSEDGFSIGEFGIADDTTTDGVTMIDAGDCSSLPSSLPVDLIAFRGRAEGGAFVLSWETASEENNAGFELQRSTDGTNFHKIGWIPGVGTTQNRQTYEFTDKDIRPNSSYFYRLQQVDYDGSSSYSETIKYVNREAGKLVLQDFAPNPVTADYADLRINSPSVQAATAVLFDAHGKAVFEKQTTLIAGLHTIRLPLRAVPAGTYFVRLIAADGQSYFKRLVVSR